MASTDFASLTELTDRLDWALDANEERLAQSALTDASDMARFYGPGPLSDAWDDPADAPRQVRVVVLTACVQYMRNPEGYTQSRAGDETVIWGEGEAHGASRGAFAFTAEQINVIRELAGKGKSSSFFGTVSTYAWNPNMAPRGDEGYVPAEGSTLFPMFASDTSPW